MRVLNKALAAALLSCMLVLAAPLAGSVIETPSGFTAQAAEIRLNKSSATSGEYMSKLTLTLKGVPASGKAKVKWKVSGKALYPAVSPVRYNDYRTVELCSAGIEGAKSTVTATYKKKKYRCSVTCRYRIPVSAIMTGINHADGRDYDKEGNALIRGVGKNTQYLIAADETNNCLYFLYFFQDKSITLLCEMRCDDGETAPARFVALLNDKSDGVESTTTIVKNTAKRSSSWQWADASKQWASIANAHFSKALDYWNELILEVEVEKTSPSGEVYTGGVSKPLCLANIGFSYYSPSV